MHLLRRTLSQSRCILAKLRMQYSFPQDSDLVDRLPHDVSGLLATREIDLQIGNDLIVPARIVPATFFLPKQTSLWEYLACLVHREIGTSVLANFHNLAGPRSDYVE